MSPSTHQPHAHTLTSAASLQVNSFDSCPLHLSQSCTLVLSSLCPPQVFTLSFLVSPRPFYLQTSSPPVQFFFNLPFISWLLPIIFIIPIQFPFPRPSCSLFLPHSLPPTYLGCVLHMHEGCGKVLASAQTLS